MKYRRILIASPGGPEVLQVCEEEIPAPVEGEVLVRIEAAGVIWADVMARRGVYPNMMPPLPYTPGYEVVGTVEKTGPGVHSERVGERILAITKVGGYAEFLCVPEKDLVLVPPAVETAEAVALGVNYVTAYQMLHRAAQVRSGQSVFYHGASGGVGTALLELGAMAALKMYGTASSRKHELVSRLGGVPIDYRAKDFRHRLWDAVGEGIDAVFDPIGGSHLWLSYRMLLPEGVLVAYGEKSWAGGTTQNSTQRMIHHILLGGLGALPGGRRVTWYDLHPLLGDHPDWVREDLLILLDMLGEGRIHPVIGERLPLEQAARAHTMLERGEALGKIVLLCRPV